MNVECVGRAALSRQQDLQHFGVPLEPAPTDRQRPFNALVPQMVKLLEREDSVACDCGHTLWRH